MSLRLHCTARCRTHRIGAASGLKLSEQLGGLLLKSLGALSQLLLELFFLLQRLLECRDGLLQLLVLLLDLSRLDQRLDLE